MRNFMLLRFLVLKLNSKLVTIIKLMNLLIQYHHWYFVMISNHFLKQWAQYKKNLNWKLTVIKCYTYGQPIKHNTEKAWKFQMDFAFHKKDLKYDQMLTIDNWFTIHLKVVCKTASSERFDSTFSLVRTIWLTSVRKLLKRNRSRKSSETEYHNSTFQLYPSWL